MLRGVPHSLQNFLPVGTDVPQPGQASLRRVPHSSQNFAPPGLVVPHFAHCITQSSLLPRGYTWSIGQTECGLSLGTGHRNYRNYRSSFSGRGPIHRTPKGLDESSPYTAKSQVCLYQGTGGVFMAHCTWLHKQETLWGINLTVL